MAMPDQSNNIRRLLIDIKESLERAVQSLRDLITTRFDTQAARMERQGALIQTGSRWTSRMSDWSEKADAALEQKDKQITELRVSPRFLETLRLVWLLAVLS
jgi:hypothetical protein